MKSTTPGSSLSVVQVALGAGILALLGIIAAFAIRSESTRIGAEPLHVPLSSTAPLMTVDSDRKPIERKPTPFAVKFVSIGTGQVDYDAGNMMLELNCVFEDQCPEQPVVGMSELGQTKRLQTDGGALYENSGGFCVIQPNIKEFKRAPFQLHSKVPLRTHALTIVHGALTVLRACERPTLSWREPFGAYVGQTQKSNGFEFTLNKFEVGNDTATVEWNCRVPSGVSGEDMWTRRELATTLVCADKTVLKPEAAKDTPTKLHRVFRLNRKFAMTLELSLISDLRQENLPFTLTNIPVNGDGHVSKEVHVGENF